MKEWETFRSGEDKSDTSIAFGALALGAFASSAGKECISGEDLSKFLGIGSADDAQIDDEVNFDSDSNADVQNNIDAGLDMDDSSNSSSSIVVEEEVDPVIAEDREESMVRIYMHCK